MKVYYASTRWLQHIIYSWLYPGHRRVESLPSVFVFSASKLHLSRSTYVVRFQLYTSMPASKLYMRFCFQPYTSRPAHEFCTHPPTSRPAYGSYTTVPTTFYLTTGTKHSSDRATVYKTKPNTYVKVETAERDSPCSEREKSKLSNSRTRSDKFCSAVLLSPPPPIKRPMETRFFLKGLVMRVSMMNTLLETPR